MPETIEQTLTQLEKLHKEATPNDWHAHAHDIYCEHQKLFSGTDKVGGFDVLLVTALRNAFPALAARIREQDREIAQLNQDIEDLCDELDELRKPGEGVERPSCIKKVQQALKGRWEVSIMPSVVNDDEAGQLLAYISALESALRAKEANL